MGPSKGYKRSRVGILLLLYLTLAAIFLTHCDAERSMRRRRSSMNKHSKKLKLMKHFDDDPSLQSSNVEPYSVSSPFSLPPYESLAPIPLPQISPPFCVYPPNPPSSTIPTPPNYYSSPSFPTPGPAPEIIPSPPGSPPTPTPEVVPSPPGNIPGSPQPILNPPVIYLGPPGPTMSPPYFEPSPPYSVPSPSGGGNIPNPPYLEPSPPYNVPSPSGGGTFPSPPYLEPSPPYNVPSPSGGGIVPSPPSSFPSPTGGSVPSPTVFQPPVVYPPPTVPPPPNAAPTSALWCVAKPTVPDPIIQESMNYACWSGAECDSIQPNGPCFEPNSVYAHASYAFNSYWQMTKANGGTCDFGGTAMLIAVDPSYDGCHFVYD